jgi:outer membrane biosynthesis protein TonB
MTFSKISGKIKQTFIRSLFQRILKFATMTASETIARVRDLLGISQPVELSTEAPQAEVETAPEVDAAVEVAPEAEAATEESTELAAIRAELAAVKASLAAITELMSKPEEPAPAPVQEVEMAAEPLPKPIKKTEKRVTTAEDKYSRIKFA